MRPEKKLSIVETRLSPVENSGAAFRCVCR